MEKAKSDMEEWLGEFTSANTKRAYRAGFNKFLQATKTTPEQLAQLTAKEARHLILEYQADAKKRGVKNNTILTDITAVRSFFGYLEKPIKFRRGKLVRIQAAKGEHVFSNGDFGKMFNCGNSFDKALLAVGVSLGWEAKAIQEMDRKQFAAFVERAKAENKEFYFFETERPKTGELRFGVLNPLALRALETYLEVSEDKAEKRLFPITNAGINLVLKRLAREANIVLTGTVRWHLLRKWLMGTLSDAGYNSFQIKLVMGKAISVSDSTYLQTLKRQIAEKYPEAYEKRLCITAYQTRNQRTEVEGLREEVGHLRRRLRVLEHVIDSMPEKDKKIAFEKTAKLMGLKVTVAKVKDFSELAKTEKRA